MVHPNSTKAYKHHITHSCSLEPAVRQTWQHHIPPSAAQDASLPGTPSTHTLVAITCWAAALSLLLLNRQRDVLTHPWGMWAHPTCFTSRRSRESLRPCRELICKACTHPHAELKAQHGHLYFIYLFSP